MSKRKQRKRKPPPERTNGNRSPAVEKPSRGERRNAEAREALEPLREDERPLVVTVGAVLSALIVLSIAIGYAAGAEVDGEQPSLPQVLAPGVLMGVMAIGMWRARYWAVLGFQAVLVFLILGASLGLVQAAGAAQAAANLGVLIVAGLLFYRMVKALARIQMPSRLPRE